MKKIAFLPFIVIAFGITSSSYAGGFTPVPTSLPMPMSTSKSSATSLQPTASFTRIDSIGNFNITISPINSSSQNSFIIKAPFGNNTEVYAAVKNGTLFLRQSPDYPNPVNVTVYMNNLTALNIFGGSTVFGNRIHASWLEINANTTGTITLNGSIMLRGVDIAGPTQLNLAWVYGNSVDIYGEDTSHLNISGNINTVRIKLDNQSFLDARYLRTQHTWIKTEDYAQAQVLASGSVQSYPENYSNVYYYKTPTVINRVNTDSGNTLQLGWSH